VLSRSVTVPWHERAAAMRAVRVAAENLEIDTLDGIRVSEADGTWCLVLPEEDQPSLTLLAEAADSAEAMRLLDRWQAVVESVG
jgi:mannose-1-phosphate guanylyltransferase/phosphomannomutase